MKLLFALLLIRTSALCPSDSGAGLTQFVNQLNFKAVSSVKPGTSRAICFYFAFTDDSQIITEHDMRSHIDMTICEFDKIVTEWKSRPINADKVIEVLIGNKEMTFKELRIILFDKQS